MRLPERQLPANRIFLIAAMLSAMLAVLTTNCADPDLWGHVQYGREVLRDRALPQTATWTFAADGAPWVNHENIAELILAGVVDTAGPAGLPWMKLAFGLALFALMLHAGRKSGSGWTAITITGILAAAAMQFHWHFRPQILTYFSLAVMLWIWQIVFADFRMNDFRVRKHAIRSLRWLWLLPPLMCFWANSHGGFAAGLAILLAGHGLAVLQLWWYCGLRHLKLQLSLIAITLTTVAASLINPYGTGLWKFMLDALLLPRPEISDWGPLELWNVEALRYWALGGVAIMSIFRNQCRSLVHCIILSLLLWQGVSHCRHLSIFAVTCGFWIPGPLSRLLSGFEQQLRRQATTGLTVTSGVKLSSSGMIPTPVLAILIGLCSIRLGPMMSAVEVDRSEYPVSAMQYLRTQGLHGNMVVTFNWAQYAIGCFASDPEGFRDSKVAVDGRFETCYPREITDLYFDFWMGQPNSKHRYRSPKSGDWDPSLALRYRNPDLILLCRHQKPSVRVMQEHQSEWTLLYQDSLSQVWGRRSLFDEPTSDRYVPLENRSISEAEQHGNVAWPAFPQAPPRVTLSSLPEFAAR